MWVWRLLLLIAAAPVNARADWTGPQVNFLGSPSPDGRRLSCADKASGDLALLELATGTLKRLTAKPAGSREFAYFSAFVKARRWRSHG